MKIRRIDLGGDRPRSIAFHPQLTVVRGLRGPHRQLLIDAIAALPDGAVAGVSGELEADGEVLPLDTEALRTLGLSHRPLDNVVRSAQFPEADVPAGRRSPRRAAEMNRDALARRLAAARSRLADAAARRVALLDEREQARQREEAAERIAAEAAAALDEASAELAAAQGRRAAAAAELESAEADRRVLAAEPVPEEEALAEARARHGAAMEARAGAERSLAEAREGLDPDAAEALASLDADVDPAVEPERDGVGGVGDTETEAPASRADLLERRRQLEVTLVPLAEVDPAPVADALMAVRAEWAVETTHLSQGSLALDLDETQEGTWPDGGEAAPEGSEAEGRPETADADMAPDETGVAAPRGLSDRVSLWDADEHDRSESTIAFEAELSEVRARVDEARATLTEAQAAAAAAAQLDPEVVAALEAAHAQVLAAQKRQGRFGRRARNLLEEARASEQQVLRQHGFSSYAEYAMSLAPSSQFLENPAVAEARADVIAAEVALAALEAEAERRATEERSAEHDLGESPDAARRPSGGDALADLGSALHEAGLAVDTTDDPVEDAAVLVSLAEHWLAEHAAASARRLEIEVQLAELDADLARLDEPGDETDARSRDAPVAPEELAARQVEAAVDRAAAEQRHARHAEAEARVAALTEEVAAGRAEVDATAAEVTAAEERLSTLDRTALAAAAEAVARAHAALAEAEIAEHRTEERVAELERGATSGVATAGVEPPASFDERLTAVTEAVEAAQAETGLLEAQLAAVERRLAEDAFDEAEEPATVASEEGRDELIGDIEWYLMSRLAAQRTEGVGGSVPILFDDAFAAFDADEAVRLASRVERLAGAIQVILLSDDDVLADWAESLGDERAGVVGAGLL